MRVFRKANITEMDQVYLMGFDAWSDCKIENDYLNDCRSSVKYKSGGWYVLIDDNKLISSLIVYNFGEEKFGIGSIATSCMFRKQGHASQLIKCLIDMIERENPNPTIFLYSDIQTEFYERFGFLKLKVEAQRYKTTTCMAYGKKTEAFINGTSSAPDYF